MLTLKQLLHNTNTSYYWQSDDDKQRLGDWFEHFRPTKLCVSWSLRKPGCVLIYRRRKANFNSTTLGSLSSADAALVISDDADIDCALAVLVIDQLEFQLGDLIKHYFKIPVITAKLIAITGTNGKSSTSHFIAQLLDRLLVADNKVGILGTLGNGIYANNRILKPAPLTTLGLIELYQQIAQLQQQGVGYIVLEVSSHAIVQERLLGLQFDVAMFTNLSHDHLDYHQTMQAYYQAKRALFSHYLKQQGVAIINTSCAWGKRLGQELNELGKTVMAVDASQGFEVCRVTQVEANQQGIKVGFKHQQPIQLGLFGLFQVENVLLAMATLYHLGFDLPEILASSQHLKAPVGRMQALRVEPYPERIFIDYAHTPTALAEALKSLGLHAGREAYIICVFGCGGNRDQQKRIKMGEIAVTYADEVIITDDNPRHEKAAAIRQAIMLGARNQQQTNQPSYKAVTIRNIGDRREAIETAVLRHQEKANSWLIIAGKGHETGQWIKHQCQPFDDYQIASQALTKQALTNP